MHLLIVVIIFDKRGQGACLAGLRKGIGGRVFEFNVKCIPFLKEGGGQCHVLLCILVAEGGVVIIVKLVDIGSGIVFVKFTGRDFT